MDANFVIVCGVLVGFIVGGLFGWWGGFITGEATERRRTEEKCDAAFQAGKRADFEWQAAQYVARQSRQLQGLE